MNTVFKKNAQVLVLFGLSIFFFQSPVLASESLSYSGRLVNTNGSPVLGPVDLKVELSYSGTPTSILCTQDFNDVALSNGVFHLKLNLTCPSTTLSEVLINVPANETTSLRVVDVSDPAHPKAYSFQAMHTMPFANIAEKAKQLVQMGASNGQILKWNNTSKNWEPGSAGGVGTVTDVTVTAPLSVSNGTSVPALSISQANTTTSGYLSSTDWNTFNSKQGTIAAGTNLQYYRGDKTWQTLNSDVVPEGATNLYFTNARVLGLPLTGFSPTSSAIAATDSVVQGFSKTQGQINTINSDSTHFLKKDSADTLSNTTTLTGILDADTLTGDVRVRSPLGLNSAVSKSYVDNAVTTSAALKLNKAGDTVTGILTLDDDLKIKAGSNYVTVKGNATTAAPYNFVLPTTAGTNGYVLKTDGTGNLSWIDPASVAAGSGTVGSGSITDGSIMDADVNASAAIAQSKIANLTSDLNTKISTSLSSGKMLIGDTGNLATQVTMSGDATISNTGVLFLKLTGTAGTYRSVTTDAQGRVTSGTNPTTLAGYGITDAVTGVTVTAPITNSGTALAPVIAMPAATTSASGYLSSSDWNTFNNKQATISKTTVQDVSKLRIYGANTTNYVELSAATLTTNRSLIFPDSNGSNGNFLTTDGAGNLSWTSPSTSTIGLVGDIGGTTGANTIGAGKVTLTHLSATGTKNNTTYLRGDNTFASFATDVQSTVLTGLSTATNAVITASDSVLGSLGKLQKQISDLTVRAVGGDLTGNLPNPTIAKLQGNTVTTSSVATKDVLKYNGTAWVNSPFAASDLSATGTANNTTYLAGDNTWKDFGISVRSTQLTGLSASGINKGNSTILATDSVTAAFNKLLFTQGDYISKSIDQTIYGSLNINSTTGFITVPNPINSNDAANKAYVDSFGQWTKGASNSIHYTAGNVGIGTTATTRDLTIKKDQDSASGLLLENMLVGTAARSIITLNSEAAGFELFSTSTTFAGTYGVLPVADANVIRSYSTAGVRPSNMFIGTGGADPLHLMTSNTPRLSIDGTGNVGIGTTTSTTKLTVTDGGTAAPYLSVDKLAVIGSGNTVLQVTSPNTATAALYFSDPESRDPGGVSYSHVTDQMLFRVNGANRMFIDNAGNVGIGTAPSEKLEVSGNVKATAYLYTSDKRLKKNVKTLDDALERVLNLRGVSFKWIATEKEEIGLIAQEVEKEEPLLVVSSETDNMKAVKYGNIVALLIEAFKEEHKNIEENQKLLAVMENGLDKVEKKVSKLERDVASLKDDNHKLQKENEDLKKEIDLIKKHLKLK